MPLSTGPFVPAGAYAHHPLQPWLFPGILPSEGVVVLASAPKAGKTCFATALARAIATGAPFLGHTVGPHPILWCAYEETMLDRDHLNVGLTSEDPFLVAYPFQLPRLEARPYAGVYADGRRGLFLADSECPFVFNHAVEVGAKLIVVDSLQAATGGADLTMNGTARRFMASLCMWSSYFHVTVLLLHHLVKHDRRIGLRRRVADSSQILAAATASFVLDREELPEGHFRVVLDGTGRYPVLPACLELVSAGPLDYRLVNEGLGGAAAEIDASARRIRRVSAADRILAYLEHHPSATAHALARDLDLNPATVRQAICQLTHRGQIRSIKTRMHYTRYALPEFPAETVHAT